MGLRIRSHLALFNIIVLVNTYYPAFACVAIYIYIYRVMLTSTLRILVNNLFKKNFYEKLKKKVINILTAFSFLIKMVLKLSKNGLLISALRALISMTYIYIYIYVRTRFSDSDRSLNRKSERFKIFKVKPKSNHNNIIINLIIILNINKNIKLVKIEKLTKII